MAEDESDKELEKEYDFILETLDKKLEHQINQVEVIDNRANMLLLALGILFVLYFDTSKNLEFHKIKNFIELILISISTIFEGICYALAVYYTLSVIRKKDTFRDDPNPRKLIDTYIKYFKVHKEGDLSREEIKTKMKEEIIKNMRDSYVANDSWLKIKNNYLIKGKWLLITGSVLLLFKILYITILKACFLN